MNSNNAAGFFSGLIFNFVILWRRIVRPHSKRESEVHEILFDRNSFILIVAVKMDDNAEGFFFLLSY